jgi:D-serine dehydratase
MIDALTKSIPHGVAVEPGAMRGAGWNVLKDDLHLPLLVLKESALAFNLASMAAWCRENGLLHAPHGKTTMCPRIFSRQLAAGAWAITAANVSQAEVCARFGVRRVLIANQVVGGAQLRSLAGLLSEYSDLECYALVDSIEGIRSFGTVLDSAGLRKRLGVFVEWGRPDWRTGVHALERVRELAAEVQRYGALRLAGVEGFEGLAQDAGEVQVFLNELGAAGAAIRDLIEQDDLLISAGGSSYLAEVRSFAQRLPTGARTVVRSGCYVTHDHGLYQQRYEAAERTHDPAAYPALRPALELWSYVQSCPRPGLAVLTFGKRDCSYDAGLPVPLFSVAAEGREPRPARGSVVRTNDQHAIFEYEPEAELRVGDKVCCGISHPCTAFDKWRVIPLVDDDYNVLELYETYF